MTATFENMTKRAQKAFGVWSGDKAFTNLPTDMQDAIVTLETFLKLMGQIVSADAPITARQRAIVALRGCI